MVISTAVPISGSYYTCWTVPRSGQVKGGGAIAQGSVSVQTYKELNVVTNADAISADNVLLARSAKAQPVKIPPQFSANDNDGDLSAWLSSTEGIPQSGPSSISLWHGIANFPQAVQGTFINTQTGEVFSLWNGDTIRVIDSNGNSALFQWTPLSSNQWTEVPGSFRNAQGNSPTASTPAQPEPTPGGTPQPVGPILTTYPGGPTQPTTVVPWYDNPTPGGTVTVEPLPDVPVGGCSTPGCVAPV
jgi:hypothetical protein